MVRGIDHPGCGELNILIGSVICRGRTRQVGAAYAIVVGLGLVEVVSPLQRDIGRELVIDARADIGARIRRDDALIDRADGERGGIHNLRIDRVPRLSDQRRAKSTKKEAFLLIAPLIFAFRFWVL